jgi:hypothetical protein
MKLHKQVYEYLVDGNRLHVGPQAGPRYHGLMILWDNDRDPDETDMNPFLGNWCNYVFNT